MKDEGGQAFIPLAGWLFFFLRGYISWGFDFYNVSCSTIFVYPTNWCILLITLLLMNMWQSALLGTVLK